MSTATAPVTPSLREKRAGQPHTSMFLRMLVRAAVLRRGRAASALMAMTVAATVATAMMNLYVDVQVKLRSEFRSYGANIVVVAKDGTSLPPSALDAVTAALQGHGQAVPFAFVVARTSSDQPVVVAGTNFDQVRTLNRWWSVSRWPSAPQEALLGMRAVPVVAPRSGPFDLTFQGRTLHLNSAGTLQTGAAEDNRVYLSMNDFVTWTGVQPSTIEVAASGAPPEVEATMQRLAAALPAADVRPVRQIVEGEARVLGKTRATLLAASVLIILTSALCVFSTLTGWVFDRRRDFAVMKALGASEKLVSGFFAAEAAALGAVGALLGYALGIGVAAWIGRANFNATVTPRLSVFPWVLAGSMVVAILSAIVPMIMLRKVQPAIILRGE